MHTEFSWRNPRNKRAYRRPRRKWKNNIKMTLKRMEKGRGFGGCGGETRGIKGHIEDLDVNGSIILK